MRFVLVITIVLSSFLAFIEGSSAQVGMASFYRSGKFTASGEKFNPGGMTAAHRTLPFGTKVRVTNVQTGKAVVVRINDRGPFIRGRIIDLAYGAARTVGLVSTGIAKVRLEILE
jgi:peptidoglycan lytic transglycosylase